MASLYLHIPFCEHKCIYCDFYSIESLDPIAAFLRALHSEIDRYESYSEGEVFETIFFGGGTPSLLSSEQVHFILEHLRSKFRFSPNPEITLETNPGTVDERKLAAFRSAGINRLSFGIQSFHDDDLKFLTRIHSAEQARGAVRTARDVGFDNVNIDLIFALPGQTISRWIANLDEALALGTQHISAYSLIVEKGTPLSRMVAAKQVSPLPIETEAEMYEFTMEYLRTAGFDHYEVSNYARQGFRSRHNKNYWNHTNYLGFGPSAHSFWSDKRWWNVRSVEGYCSKLSAGELPVAGEELLTIEQLFDEAVMLGLRSEGIDLHRLKEKFHVDLLAGHGGVIPELIEQKMAVMDDHVLRLTDRGYLLCDAISQRLTSVEFAP